MLLKVFVAMYSSEKLFMLHRLLFQSFLVGYVTLVIFKPEVTLIVSNG